jgi:hypothetical protein
MKGVSMISRASCGRCLGSQSTPLLEGYGNGYVATLGDGGPTLAAPTGRSDGGGNEEGGESGEGTDFHRMQGRIAFAMNASLVANVLLLVAKIVAFILSSSKAVLASAADSFVDIASQVYCIDRMCVCVCVCLCVCVCV